MGRKEEKQQEKNRIEAAKKYAKAIHFGNANGDAAEEISMLDEVIELDPSAYWAYATKAGELYLSANAEDRDYHQKLAEIKAAVNKAADIKSDSPQVVYVQWRTGNSEMSKEATMAQIVTLPAVTLRDHIAHARAHKLMGNNALAIAKYQQILHMKENAKNFELWSNLAELLYDTKDFSAAAAAYQSAVAIDKKFAVGWNYLGNSLSELGKHKAAEAAYKKSIKYDPEVVSSVQNLASCLGCQGEYKKSIELEKKALKMDNATDTDKAASHYDISISMQKHADRDLVKKPSAYETALKDALTQVDLGVKLDPGNILYLCQEADLLGKLGQKSDALGFLCAADQLYAAAMADGASLKVTSGCLEFIKNMLTTEKAQLQSELHIETAPAIEKFMAEFSLQHPELSDSDASYHSDSLNSSGDHGELMGAAS
jgi:tetratricopeptide (TPR) repeat protein